MTSLRVQRFKAIVDAPCDIGPINVFIGANNSGKSSVAQLLHFSISILQAIELADRWGNKEFTSLSLSPAELHYTPCIDLYALGLNGKLNEDKKDAIELRLVLADGSAIRAEIRRGRNGNIRVQRGCQEFCVRGIT